MNDYRHVNEIEELATSRRKWMIAAYATMAMWFITLGLVGCGAI